MAANTTTTKTASLASGVKASPHVATSSIKESSSHANAGQKKPVSATAPLKVSSRDSDVSSSGNDPPLEKKKIPPIKAPVGLAKGPDLKNCKSKVGSLNNIKHAPAGGRVTIQTQKLNWNAKSKVGSLDNKEHKPGGGKVKIFSDPSYVNKKDSTSTKPTSANAANHEAVTGASCANKTSSNNKKDSQTNKISGDKPNTLAQDMKGLKL